MASKKELRIQIEKQIDVGWKLCSMIDRLRKENIELKSRIVHLEAKTSPLNGLKTVEQMNELFCSEARLTFITGNANEDIEFKMKVVCDENGMMRRWDYKRDGHYFDGFAAQPVLAGESFDILVAGNVDALEMKI